MKEILIKEYNNTEILGIEHKEPSNSFIVHFINGAFFEVKGPMEKNGKPTRKALALRKWNC